MKIQIICPKCYERLYAPSFFGLFKLPKCPTCKLLKQMKSNSRNLLLHGHLPGAETIKHIAAIRSEFPNLIIELNGQMRQACFHTVGDYDNRVIIDYDSLDYGTKLIREYLNK